MVGKIKASAGLDILLCRRLPGRVNENQTATLLGVAECGLPLLNHHGLLALAMRAATEEGDTL